VIRREVVKSSTTTFFHAVARDLGGLRELGAGHFVQQLVVDLRSISLARSEAARYVSRSTMARLITSAAEPWTGVLTAMFSAKARARTVPEAWLSRGHRSRSDGYAHEVLGHVGQAITAFERALELDPDHDLAREALADCREALDLSRALGPA
jgi:tetratricopeptide (TPR) repeat protein